MSFNCSKCSKCSREYDSEETYNKHIKLNRCKEPYECKSCNYITKKKTDFTKHLNTKKCKNNSPKESPKNFKCERCGNAFRDNYDLQRHLNKKVPCLAQGAQGTTINNTINNIPNNKTISDNYIYILQDRTSVQLNTNIYKIGKTKQSNLKRFSAYPKGYKIIMLMECFNCDIIENKLIKLFKSKYEQVLEYGNEYFKGDLIEMKKDIFLFSL